MDSCKTVDSGVGCCVGSIPTPVDIGIDSIPITIRGGEDIGSLIENKIAEFVDTIGANFGVLRLDGYIDNAAQMKGEVPENLMDLPEGFKIDNERFEESFIVPIDTIICTPMNVLIDALKTNEFVKVHGVTRIVGYYSRVKNWNRSKIGELRDRQKGNYGVSPVAQALRDIHMQGHIER